MNYVAKEGCEAPFRVRRRTSIVGLALSLVSSRCKTTYIEGASRRFLANVKLDDLNNAGKVNAPARTN